MRPTTVTLAGRQQMTDLLKEFRDFALKGNLIELGTALVLALAFNNLINSMVDHILMPIVGIIFGEPSFDSLDLTINDSVILYGSFITNVVSFVLIAAAVFFFVVKPYNAIMEARRNPAPNAEPTPEPEEITLLKQIAANTAR
jgi:large conductance mechanosensitive channel